MVCEAAETKSRIVFFRCVRKIAKRVYERRHVCLSLRLSVRIEQLESQSTDFLEISYLCILQKSVKDTEVSLKSDRNNEYFT